MTMTKPDILLFQFQDYTATLCVKMGLMERV